jgi:hypothetical protein
MRHIETPMSITYTPELDITEELNKKDVTFFQELIGVLRWAMEIGRVDIQLEVSLLSQYEANPREGHLEQLLHIFAFLKHHPKLTLYCLLNYRSSTSVSFGPTRKISQKYIAMPMSLYHIACQFPMDKVSKRQRMWMHRTL